MNVFHIILFCSFTAKFHWDSVRNQTCNSFWMQASLQMLTLSMFVISCTPMFIFHAIIYSLLKTVFIIKKMYTMSVFNPCRNIVMNAGLWHLTPAALLHISIRRRTEQQGSRFHCVRDENGSFLHTNTTFEKTYQSVCWCGVYYMSWSENFCQSSRVKA